MNFVLGFVAGVAAAAGGLWGYSKHLRKAGVIMELKDAIKEMAAGGDLIYVPDRFPIAASEEKNKWYVDVDQIRLVVEDGELVGWYDPSGELEA